MNDTPCQMGCPCPGPKPAAIYKDFTTAVDALKLVFLKPGHMMPVYYYDASTDIHCLIGVGNIDPNKLKLIISDSSDKWSLLLKFALIDASLGEISSLEYITDASIAELFNKKYTITISNTISGSRIVNTSTAALYKEGDKVILKAITNGAYGWKGWYTDASSMISSDDSYEVTVYGSMNVNSVKNVKDMTNASLYGLFSLQQFLDASLSVENSSIIPEKNQIIVSGADKSTFEKGYFDSGNYLTFDTSLDVQYDLVKYVITAKDPTQILNWGVSGNIKTVDVSSFTLEKVKTDVSVNAIIKEVKFSVDAQANPNITTCSITGDDEGYVIRGTEIIVSYKEKPEVTEGYNFIGWYVNDEQVSLEQKYKCTPTVDTTYVAKFIAK